MFIRTRCAKIKNGSTQTYASLVENRWSPTQKKILQRTVMALGNVNDLPSNGLIEKVITALDRFATKQGFSSLSSGVVLADLSDETKLTKTYDWGVWLLAKHLLKQLKLSSIFSQVYQSIPPDKRRLSAAKFLASVTAMLAIRFEARTHASERSTLQWYQKQLFLPKAEKVKLGKNDLYRSLDILVKHKDEIEFAYWQQNQDLFNQRLDLVLFDTTSLYYWGERGPAALAYERYQALSLEEKLKVDKAGKAPLLAYGHSKDGRGDLKQAIVGVLMTPDGKPIAHETFPGNQSDLVSFARIIDKVKAKYQAKYQTEYPTQTRYQTNPVSVGRDGGVGRVGGIDRIGGIGKIIFIGDRGMVSEQNLTDLENSGHEYIVGVRMRQLSPFIKDWVLNWGVDEMTRLKPEPSDPEHPQRGVFVKELPIEQWKRGNEKAPSHTRVDEAGNLKPRRGRPKEANWVQFVKSLYRKTDLRTMGATTGSLDIHSDNFKRTEQRILARRYLLAINTTNQQAQAKKRKYFEKILEKKLVSKTDKEWLVKNGYKKYIKVSKLEMSLDRDKLKAESQYDGKWVLLTNVPRQTKDPHTSQVTGLTPVQVGRYYQTLQLIERGFRDLKGLVTVRPIFHFTEQRIQAHIFVCFLSLVLKWYINHKLSPTGDPSHKPGKRFMETMTELKAIAVDETLDVYVRTEISNQIMVQMKKLKLSVPGKVIWDKRKKPKAPPKRPGRPRKDKPAPGQVSLVHTI